MNKFTFKTRYGTFERVNKKQAINLFTDTWGGVHHYRFTGHSIGEEQEARWIAQHHENKDKVMRGCRS